MSIAPPLCGIPAIPNRSYFYCHNCSFSSVFTWPALAICPHCNHAHDSQSSSSFPLPPSTPSNCDQCVKGNVFAYAMCWSCGESELLADLMDQTGDVRIRECQNCGLGLDESWIIEWRLSVWRLLKTEEVDGGSSRRFGGGWKKVKWERIVEDGFLKGKWWE